jgi:hypothetical protein
VKGNDYERKRHKQEEAAFLLSGDKPISQEGCVRPFISLQEILIYKALTTNCSRIRAGVGALFNMAGMDISRCP